MRLDKYLKLSRLIKRRTEAKKACLAGCVKVNHRIAKAGEEVKPTDKVEIDFKNKILIIEINEIPTGNIPNCQVSSLYKIIKEIKKED